MVIYTKFLAPTGCLGARVKAYTEDGLKATVAWDHALMPRDNHDRAVSRLLNAYRAAFPEEAGRTYKLVRHFTDTGWVYVHSGWAVEL